MTPGSRLPTPGSLFKVSFRLHPSAFRLTNRAPLHELEPDPVHPVCRSGRPAAAPFEKRNRLAGHAGKIEPAVRKGRRRQPVARAGHGAHRYVARHADAATGQHGNQPVGQDRIVDSNGRRRQKPITRRARGSLSRKPSGQRPLWHGYCIEMMN